MSFIVLRVRGRPKRNPDQEMTLKNLRLHAPNHATIVPNEPSYTGMVRKVEHFVTYGELTSETAMKLLEARGRLPGNRELTDEAVAEHTEYGSIQELAEAIAEGDVDINKFAPIKPVFRLNPPRGGYENNKRHFTEGGTLGYRGGNINQLIERML
ncbi:MAG: 50S ribosomal protein L30 [Candidatus Thermoplasmatota archaeon]|nr:50S ribosomal protein L30 [Candidatus Thermoplasmatota archaeon]